MALIFSASAWLQRPKQLDFLERSSWELRSKHRVVSDRWGTTRLCAIFWLKLDLLQGGGNNSLPNLCHNQKNPVRTIQLSSIDIHAPKNQLPPGLPWHASSIRSPGRNELRRLCPQGCCRQGSCGGFGLGSASLCLGRRMQKKPLSGLMKFVKFAFYMFCSWLGCIGLRWFTEKSYWKEGYVLTTTVEITCLWNLMLVEIFILSFRTDITFFKSTSFQFPIQTFHPGLKLSPPTHHISPLSSLSPPMIQQPSIEILPGPETTCSKGTFAAFFCVFLGTATPTPGKPGTAPPRAAR